MTAYRTNVEEFALYGDDGSSLHYERDHDLFITTKSAIRGGEQAGLVFVELGIDGHATHAVRLDFGLVPESDAFHYDRNTDEVRALTDAIDALTAVRDRLAAMADETD